MSDLSGVVPPEQAGRIGPRSAGEQQRHRGEGKNDDPDQPQTGPRERAQRGEEERRQAAVRGGREARTPCYPGLPRASKLTLPGRAHLRPRSLTRGMSTAQHNLTALAKQTIVYGLSGAALQFIGLITLPVFAPRVHPGGVRRDRAWERRLLPSGRRSRMPVWRPRRSATTSPTPTTSRAGAGR